MSIQPFTRIETTAFKERQSMINKINEIVDNVNSVIAYDPDDFYNKSAIDDMLNGYYTKSEIDTEFTDYYDKSTIDSMLSDNNGYKKVDVSIVRDNDNKVDLTNCNVGDLIDIKVSIAYSINGNSKTFSIENNFIIANTNMNGKLNDTTFIESVSTDNFIVHIISNYHDKKINFYGYVLDSTFTKADLTITNMSILHYDVLRG